MPASITKFGWDVNIKPIQEEFSSKWVGSLITCLRSYSVAKQSILVPSKLLLSLMHQLDDQALKSPIETAKKGLLSVVASKFHFKSSRNESKLSAVWLGDWCKF